MSINLSDLREMIRKLREETGDQCLPEFKIFDSLSTISDGYPKLMLSIPLSDNMIEFFDACTLVYPERFNRYYSSLHRRKKRKINKYPSLQYTDIIDDAGVMKVNKRR